MTGKKQINVALDVFFVAHKKGRSHQKGTAGQNAPFAPFLKGIYMNCFSCLRRRYSTGPARNTRFFFDSVTVFHSKYHKLYSSGVFHK